MGAIKRTTLLHLAIRNKTYSGTIKPTTMINYKYEVLEFYPKAVCSPVRHRLTDKHPQLYSYIAWWEVKCGDMLVRDDTEGKAWRKFYFRYCVNKPKPLIMNKNLKAGLITVGVFITWLIGLLLSAHIAIHIINHSTQIK